MKKIISLVIVLATLATMTTVFAKPNSTAHMQADYKTTRGEEIIDQEGNTIRIEYGSDDKSSYSFVYMNGVLTQKAYANPENNEIIYEEYSANARSVQPIKTETYKYSDYVQELRTEESPKKIVSTRAFSTEGWSYYGYYPVNSMIAYSKPVTMYFRNYDEEPDRNRFLTKRFTFTAGVALAVISAALALFTSPAITVLEIIKACGTFITGTVIANYIDSEICLSRQKIRYAPVVNGTNVFPDAYITKCWEIITNKLTGKETLDLYDPYYENNRGATPDWIATNAQSASQMW